MQCVEMWMHMTLFGEIKSYINMWTVFMIFTEFGSLLIFFYCRFHEGDVLRDVPFLLPLMIFSRWAIFQINLLYTDFFGSQMIPVYLAVLSPQSLRFMIFLFFVILMCAHVYLGFPVKEDGKTLGQYGLWGVYEAIYRMWDLLMFGDVNNDDMTGRQLVVGGGGIIQHEDAPDASYGKPMSFEGLFEPVRIVCLLFATGGSIMTMQMYVGVLSNVFNDLKEHETHTRLNWKMHFTRKYFLRMLFWSRIHPIFDKLMSYFGKHTQVVSFEVPEYCYKPSTSVDSIPHVQAQDGAWFVMRSIWSSDNDALRHKLQEIKSKLKKLGTSGMNTKFTS